jgi:hypothetical protein
VKCVIQLAQERVKKTEFCEDCLSVGIKLKGKNFLTTSLIFTREMMYLGSGVRADE